MSGVPTLIRTRNRSRFARQGPQPADLGLVLGTPGEVVAAVCRSVCLQVLGIAGLEFVCVFGHDAFEYFDHTATAIARCAPQKVYPALIAHRPRRVNCSLVTLPVDQVLAQDAIACNNDVGVHTKMLLNVRHRVVSPVCIAERTVSLRDQAQTLAREQVTRRPLTLDFRSTCIEVERV